jgi:hypothetical protein
MTNNLSMKLFNILPIELLNKIFLYIYPQSFIIQIKDLCKTLDIYKKDKYPFNMWKRVSYYKFMLDKNYQKMLLNGFKLRPKIF